jgi:hypothetical protein
MQILVKGRELGFLTWTVYQEFFLDSPLQQTIISPEPETGKRSGYEKPEQPPIIIGFAGRRSPSTPADHRPS